MFLNFGRGYHWNPGPARFWEQKTGIDLCGKLLMNFAVGMEQSSALR